MTQFVNSFSEEIWKQSFKHSSDDTIDDTLKRVAKYIASAENSNELREIYEEKFYEMLSDFAVVPAGRVISNAGANYTGTTLINCYVSPKVEYDMDSLNGIMEILRMQSQTLKSEGGWGMNFSFIRPRGSYIKGIGVESPGSVKYMELFDKSSDIITQGSGKSNKNGKQKIRKGAMMGILSCWHPDIKEFISAKQHGNNLSKFNISVNLTDEFMQKYNKVLEIKELISKYKIEEYPEDSTYVEYLNRELESTDLWNLEFPDTTDENYKSEWFGDLKDWKSKGYKTIIYDTIKCTELFDSIMQSTYNRNDPGVIFLDRANDYNPLNYAETIMSTNPCIVVGERFISDAGYERIESITTANNTMGIVPVTSWKTGTKPIVRLTDEYGYEYLVTPDHRFLDKSGNWIEAKDTNGKTIAFNNSVIPWKGTSSSVSRLSYAKLHLSASELFSPQSFSETGDSIKYTLTSSTTNKDYFNTEFGRIVDFSDKVYRLNYDKLHTFINGLISKFLSPSQSFTDFVFSNKSFDKSFVRNLHNLLLVCGLVCYRTNPYTLHLKNSNLVKFLKREELEFINEHYIVSVEDIGEDDVYDFNEPILNRAIYNGSIVHNCGEQTLSYANVCNLISINLTKFIDSANVEIDYEKLKRFIPIIVRFSDNVITVGNAPLEQYKQSMIDKRRIGIGVMGFGSLLYMLGIRYASDKAIELQDKLMPFIAKHAYMASIDLAVEKGKFPLCNTYKHSIGKFIASLGLSDEYMNKLSCYGIRNSSLLSIQPTGQTGILANNVSGGLEPVFSPEYIRTVIVPNIPEELIGKAPRWYHGDYTPNEFFKEYKEGNDIILRYDNGEFVYKIDRNRGLTKEVLCEDYGVYWRKENLSWDSSADYAVTASELSAYEHCNSMNHFAKYLDSACSKTVNVNNDYPYEDFKKLYLDAYNTGYIRGITTYRAGTMASVLSKAEEPSDEEIIIDDVKLPRSAKSITETLLADGKKWYLFVTMLDNVDTPFALFVKTNIKEPKVTTHDAIEKLHELALTKGIPLKYITSTLEKIEHDNNSDKLARMISLCLRHGILIKNIVSTLDKVDNVFVGSFLFQIKKYLSKFIKNGTKIEGAVCSECNSKNVVFSEGCFKCGDCGSSKCG